MKKLLSLLSVLTITGTAMPNVIATSNYEKQKEKRKRNNSENLKRSERNVNQNNPVVKTDGADIPTEEQIKQRLKEKNPNLDITKIIVTEITKNSAVISANNYSGKKTINFTVDKSIDLSILIPNWTNIGQIFSDEEGKQNHQTTLIFEEKIKYLLKQWFPLLDTSKIKINQQHTTSSEIVSNDINTYTGKTNVIYTLPISFYIKSELGVIKTNGLNIPTEEQIKDKINEILNINNNTRFLNILKIDDITYTNAKIKCVKNDFVSGELDINFTVDKSILLSDLIKTTDLGEFLTDNLSNPTEEQIKQRLKEKNPNLDITKIKVKNITNSSATIISTDNNIYSGNSIIIYSVSINSLNW